MLCAPWYGDWRSIEGQHSCKHTHRQRLQTAEKVDFIHPYSPYGDAAVLIIDSCGNVLTAERGVTVTDFLDVLSVFVLVQTF